MSSSKVLLSLFCLGIGLGTEYLHAGEPLRNHRPPAAAAQKPRKEDLLFLEYDKVNPTVEKPSGVSFRILPDGNLQIDFRPGQKEAGVTLRPREQEVWDLSNCAELLLRVTNPGKTTTAAQFRIYGRDGSHWFHTCRAEVGPGKSETVRFPLNPRGFKFDPARKLVNMAGCPALLGGGVNLRQVDRIMLYADPVAEACSLIFQPIRGRFLRPDQVTEEFFPFIDGYGQFIHEEWPGKVHSAADFEADRQKEAADLKRHPGPADRNEFGGWESGPTLKATGHFRTEKWNGRWYFVDPKGKLFWSHGLDCVTMFNSTPVQYREHYFREIPAAGALAKYQGAIHWAPLGFYKDKKLPVKSYNFGMANLHRKYGENFRKAYFDLCHRRLRSWGFNTIGNWTEFSFCEMSRTPYVRGLGLNGPRIPGSDGWWGQFPDPFHPDFRANLIRECRKNAAGVADDPYCIGFFSDNELAWGKGGRLAHAVLKAPAALAAKQHFVQYLQRKYAAIENLNRAWKCNRKDWNDLLHSRDTVPPENHPDTEELTGFLARQLFSVCRDTIKQFAPQKLYLGTRFSTRHGDAVERAAAEYCDVVTFNRYSRSVEELDLPEGAKDTPIMIGEYHFGGLDRGMFHGGLQTVNTQQERAAAYEKYIVSALQNPRMVGAHWFQFADQPTTGRFEGENFQIGFVSITDTPYETIIRKSREIGDKLYQLRQIQKNKGKAK